MILIQRAVKASEQIRFLQQNALYLGNNFNIKLSIQHRWIFLYHWSYHPVSDINRERNRLIAKIDM